MALQFILVLSCDFCIGEIFEINAKWQARRGGVEVAGWTLDRRSGFNSRYTLTACWPSNGKEVKDVSGRPCARVEVGSACQRPLAAHGVGCPAAGQNLETGHLSCHYIHVAEISLNVKLNPNQ